MSLADELRAAELPRAAISALGGEEGVWIAGGAVRDAALGRPITDLDLAVAGDPGPVAKALGRELGEHAFELSAEFGTWRVVAPARGWQVDITALRGDSIEADLALRDFTIGAAAVPLAAGEVLDPYDGLVDLERGVLRVVGPSSFLDDPLRLLRAARLAANLDLRIDADTVALAHDAAGRAAEPAGERQLAELRQLLGGPTRCAASGCSTSSASPPSSCPSWRAPRASARAPTTTSTCTGTRSRCSPTRSRSSASCPASSAPSGRGRPPTSSPSRSPTRWTARSRCASAPSCMTLPSPPPGPNATASSASKATTSRGWGRSAGSWAACAPRASSPAICRH